MYTLESFMIIVKYLDLSLFGRSYVYTFQSRILYMCLWKSNMFKCAFESIRRIILFVAKPGYFVALLYKLWHPLNIPWNFKMIVTQNIKLDREGDGMTCETINKTCGKNNDIN